MDSSNVKINEPLDQTRVLEIQLNTKLLSEESNNSLQRTKEIFLSSVNSCPLSTQRKLIFPWSTKLSHFSSEIVHTTWVPEGLTPAKIEDVLRSFKSIPNYDPLRITSLSKKRFMIFIVGLSILVLIFLGMIPLLIYGQIWIAVVTMVCCLSLAFILARLCCVKAKTSGISKFSSRIVDLRERVSDCNHTEVFMNMGYFWKAGSLGAWIELHVPDDSKMLRIEPQT
jgi:hypothetical protein